VLRQLLLLFLQFVRGVSAVPVDLATGVGKPFKQFPLLGRVAILPARHSHLRIGVSTALVARPYCDGMTITELNLDL